MFQMSIRNMGTSSMSEDLRVWQRAGPGSDPPGVDVRDISSAGFCTMDRKKHRRLPLVFRSKRGSEFKKPGTLIVAAPAPGNFKSSFKGGTVPLPPSSRGLKHPRPSRPLYLPWPSAWPLVSACFPKKKALRSPPCSCCSACLCSSAS